MFLKYSAAEMNMNNIQAGFSATGRVVGDEVLQLNYHASNFAASVPNQYFSITNYARSSATQEGQPDVGMCHSSPNFMARPNTGICHFSKKN